MKKIRTLLTIIVFILLLLIQNEQYFCYFLKFQGSLSFVELYLDACLDEDENGSSEKMVADIMEAAEKHNVSVMFYEIENVSDLEMDMTIYADENFRDTLIKKYYIHEGTFRSLISGTMKVEFKDIEFGKKCNMEEITTFYLLGTYDDTCQFKSDLTAYAGCFPQPGTRDSSIVVVTMIWLVAGIFLVFLTLICLLYTKKTFAIAVLMGRSRIAVWCREWMPDCLSLLVCFWIYACVTKWLNIRFHFGLVSLFVLAIVVIKFLLSLQLLSIDIGKSIKHGDDAKLILNINRSFRIIFCAALCVVIVTCISALQKGWCMYSQKSFFESFKDYDYLHIWPIIDTETWQDLWDSEGLILDRKTNQDLYLKYSDTSYCFCSNPYIFSDKLNNHEVVTVNSNSAAWLKKQYNLEFTEEKKCTILYPDYLDADELEEKLLPGIQKNYGTDITIADYEMQPYPKTIHTTIINNNLEFGSDYTKNPVFIVLNVMPFSETYDSNVNDIYLYDTMYHISDQQIAELKAKLEEKYSCEMTVKRTNVYENYMYYWQFVKKEMAANIVFLILIVMLSAASSRALIQCDMEINGNEHAIRYLLGQNTWQRNKRVILPSVVIWCIELLAIPIICHAVNESERYWIILGIAIGLFFDILQSAFSLLKAEQKNVLKTINGGDLF